MSWFSEFSDVPNDGPNHEYGYRKNESIKRNANIVSNWDYRTYLQNNANNIMKFNTMSAAESSGNNPFIFINSRVLPNQPHMFQSTHDDNMPMVGMNSSNLKDNYINKERINSRMIAPSIPTTPSVSGSLFNIFNF